MPPVLDPSNIYSADGPGNFAPATAGALSRVYVPNGISDTVDVIDPATDKVVKTLKVGRLPQHVVPSWDLKTLWVTDDKSNDLMAIGGLAAIPGCGSVIAGATSPEQVKANAAAGDWIPSPAQLAELDEIIAPGQAA